MKRRITIATIILAALGYCPTWANAQQPNSQVSSYEDFAGQGSGGFIGDASPTPSRMSLPHLPAQSAQPIGSVNRTIRQVATGCTQCGSTTNCGCQPGAAPGCATKPATYACQNGCRGNCDGGCATGWEAACNTGACNTRDGSRYFGGVEVMHIYASGRSLGQMVTSSIDPLDEGVLGRATTYDVFGGDIGENRLTGGRVTFGSWLDDQRLVAGGVRFFTTETDQTGYASAANGAPGSSVIARPFFNVDPLVNGEDSYLVAAPGVSAGNIDIRTSSDIINGEAFIRYLMWNDCNVRVDFLTGYHFNRIDDGLEVRHFSQSLAPGGPPPIGATYDVFDSFEVSNEFHGGQLGMMAEWQTDNLTLNVLGKVSLGNNHQQVSVAGRTIITDPIGNMSVAGGGLLAQPFNNIGMYENNEFTYIPEFGVTASYALTQRLDLTVGYTFMYFSDIATAGGQIDRVVNGSQLSGGNLVGPARPELLDVVGDSFTLHSINIGVSGKY
jgi:hypothetical protein